MYLHLKGREREGQIFHLLVHSAMSATTVLGLTKTRSLHPTQVSHTAQTQHPEPIPAASQGMHLNKAASNLDELVLDPCTSMWDTGIPSGDITPAPNANPHQ